MNEIESSVISIQNTVIIYVITDYILYIQSNSSVYDNARYKINIISYKNSQNFSQN